MEDKLSEALDKMYDLGYKHGYEIAKKDMEIAQLEREVDMAYPDESDGK